MHPFGPHLQSKRVPPVWTRGHGSQRTERVDESPGYVLNHGFDHGNEVAEERGQTDTDKDLDRTMQRTLHKAEQPAAASSRHVSPSLAESVSANDVRQVLAKRGESRRTGKVTPRGFEPRFLD
jgi:hypothetical protein